ncbi:hypothetical protein IJ541_04705 [bacterium]|nr:hypothetical protein [bacterium]
MSDYASNMRLFGNINCTLASLVNWGEQRQNGVDPQTANFNFFRNMTNGMARNEIAYDMARHGNYTGINTNIIAGYGNERANAFGTTALLTLNDPYFFFAMNGCMYPPAMYGTHMHHMGMVPPPPPMPMMGMGGFWGCPGGGFLC